ncbi:SDR family oxidoreductase [Amnimonas aquatica]|uniref:Short-chain dehydrogenase n=1 Tax=Amnimonas aquatica TaxID=2094561 RepID=A0A2P6AT29_9GAMM|nr:SDR family oxidoreductase [Amnimonas aquatica]PQA44802.1 short-chain dehydrogenase [Amnimonas aquatica]
MSRTVLITGCSTGIGRALALELHGRGLTVCATARRPETLAELHAAGLRTYALDVCSPASIAALAEQLAADGLVPDALVNNAGYGAMGPLLELPSDELQRQFDTNVFALMAVTRAFVPGMIARRRGLVVNVGSVSGVLPTPFSGAYCATKAAVHALSDALRIELAPFGVDVLVVQPGGIESQFGATAGQGASERRGDLALYAPLAAAIDARAAASQQNATPAAEFARQLADAMQAGRPAPVVRIGHGSFIMPQLKRWLPTRVLDRVLARRFGLDRLASGD